MGRKNVVKSYKMIDAGDLSGDITSESTSVINLDKASIHIVWSGSSPSGTINVQAKNGDKGTWRSLDFGTTISVSGNSGEHDIILNELPFDEIRVVYTSTSGTGTVDAVLTAKVIVA